MQDGCHIKKVEICKETSADPSFITSHHISKRFYTIFNKEISPS